SFNAMLRGLRWFELYVPKTIVERLIKRGDMSESLSDTRDITALFTDMVGFSTASQGMTAPEVATFVNHHFTLVAKCIEAQGGTVDKFIGDAVMAFWDEPQDRHQQVARAARAALEIAKAIRADNKTREKSGEAPVGIRIGIHAGGATVGNIGAPGRINYTIIGDTVNIAQRLEQLGKAVFPKGTEVTILVSDEVARALGPEFNPVSQGQRILKGRVGKMPVFSLE
ncbi:MAG: adenylate/guanylate cyclase domain-containing protein, partial [Hyphomicrobiales bacterium]